MIHVSYVPAFDDNYIWFIQDDAGKHAAIVDPGDADPVIDYLEQHSITPVAILITHHHGDHTGGISELLARYEMPVYGPAHETIRQLSNPIEEGDTVDLDFVQLQVLDVPGHTRGHVAYYTKGALFCGDTLFAGGCGRLFEGTPEQMWKSLSKFIALPDDTQVYCAHEYTEANLKFALVAEPGNDALKQRIAETRELRAKHLPTVPSSLELEKATNPFLRCMQPNIIHAAEGFAKRHLKKADEVFAVVRHWKDTLD
jgi:hydroxyacylglutathione hydrolase